MFKNIANIYVLLVAVGLLTTLISCGGEDITRKVNELHDEAKRLSEEAVAFQEQGKPGAAQTRYHEAVSKYMEVFELAPDKSDAWLHIGILYNYFKDYDKAEEALDKAIGLNSKNGKVYFYRGLVYLAKDDPQEAEIALKMAIDRDVEYPPAYYYYGRVEFDLGDFYNAKTALDKYISLDPQGRYSAAAQGLLGMLPEEIVTPPQDVNILPVPQDDGAAVQPPGEGDVTAPPEPVQPPPEPTPEPVLPQPQPQPVQPQPQPTPPPPQPEPVDDEAGSEDPFDGFTLNGTSGEGETEPPPPEPKPEPEPEPETYSELIEAGRWAMATSDNTTAISHLRKAYALEPHFNEVNYLLGKVYRATGSLDKAIDHLKVAIDRKADDANSMVEIAYCYEAKGDKSSAIDYFERSLAIKDREDIRSHVEELRAG